MKLTSSSHFIFFFRGLNTRAHNRLQIGPFQFEEMSMGWKRELQIHRHTVVEMPYHQNGKSYRERAENLVSEIQSHPVWNQTQIQIHLLGHSAGGLIAKWIYSLLQDQNRIASVTTLATPHNGSGLAKELIQLSEQKNWKNSILRKFNYDLSSRSKILMPLTPEALNSVQPNIYPHNQKRVHSFVFQKSKNEMSVPLAWLQKHREFKSLFSKSSDGVIETESQKWGQCHGPFPLDHLEQMGYHFYWSPKKREQSQLKFKEVVNNYSNLIQNLDKT